MLTQLAIFVGGCLIIIAYSVYQMVGKMTASPDVKEKPELAPFVLSAIDQRVADFVASKGFKFANAYQFHTIRIGHWVQGGDSPPLRRLSVSLSSAGTNYEFITEFSDDHSLTTTKTRAAFMFPRPFGSFLQSFPKVSIERLWDLHTQGEQHIISHLSIPVKKCLVPYPQGSGPAILRQMRCIKSYPLWPVRGIYWFLVKRFLMLNRPIWKQDVRNLYKQIA